LRLRLSQLYASRDILIWLVGVMSRETSLAGSRGVTVMATLLIILYVGKSEEALESFTARRYAEHSIVTGGFPSDRLDLSSSVILLHSNIYHSRRINVTHE